MPNAGLPIKLSSSERAQLKSWESAHGTPQQVALRCRIILRALASAANVSIAEELEVNRVTVQLWRKRVHQRGIGEVWQAYTYDANGDDLSFRGWASAVTRYNGGGDPNYLQKVTTQYQSIKGCATPCGP